MYGSQTQWGHLTLLGYERKKITALDLNGMAYETGEIGPTMMKLLCECGHHFEIEKRFFPGRRQLRDCGREKECKFAAGAVDDTEQQKNISEARRTLIAERAIQIKTDAQNRLIKLQKETGRLRLPGRPLSNKLRGQPITIYVSNEEYEAILNYSSKKGVTLSRAAGAMIQLGANQVAAQEELLAQAEIEQGDKQREQAGIEQPGKSRESSGSGRKGHKLRVIRTT